MTRALIATTLVLLLSSGKPIWAHQTGPNLADPIVADASKPIVLIARRGAISVQNFGRIGGGYFYAQRFTPEGGPPGIHQVEGLLPPVWRVMPGGRLTVTLHNDLGLPEGGPCEDTRTNLHTHGLLVSPWTPDESPFNRFGDNIFVETMARNCLGNPPSPHAHGPNLGTSIGYDILLPQSHPTGLFWYHPHAHGVVRKQVGGGLAGLITVGDVSDFVRLDCSGPGGAECARRPEPGAQPSSTAPESHFLLLRDMQVQSLHAPFAHYLVDDPDPGLCASSQDPLPDRFGRCGPAGGDTAWLFPVNAQLHPNIVVRPQGHIWRIGNTGANVTYRLVLQDSGRALQAGAQDLCMRVLSRDGVPVIQDGSAPVFESEIILMPGSRVELAISHEDALNLAGGRVTARGTPCGLRDSAGFGAPFEAELVTLGFDTGSNPPDAPSPAGDPWPAIKLASVLLEPRPPAAPSPRMFVAPLTQAGPANVRAAVAGLRSRVLQDQAIRSSTAPSTPAAAGRSGCGPAGDVPAVDADSSRGEVRVIWFSVGRKGQQVPPDIPDRDPARIVAALGEDNQGKDPTSPATFEVGNEVRDAVGNRIAGSGTLQTFDPTRTDVCLHAGHREVWRLVNLSDETHNFHIHQSKFRVLAVYDPYGQLRHEAPWALAPDLAHDVYPVPKFGYVDVEIGFAAMPESAHDVVSGIRYTAAEVGPLRPQPVQVGRFVFHCHILEHEDGGMMGVIEVLP